MNPCPTREQLQRWLGEDLPAPERSPLEEHIEQCRHCQQTLEELFAATQRRAPAPADAPAHNPLLGLRRPQAEGAEPRPRPTGDTTDGLLHFLAPTARPDSLGRLDHYEVLEVLGRGGFGIVYRAFDDVLQRVVAIKVLAPELAATSPARKRFLREARAAAQVRHENVVQIYAVEEEPLPYLVMEFIPGETLQQRLDRAGPFDAAEVVSIGRQVADGLAAAHAAGLIHRDIKPANVLLEQGPRLRVKVTDFGLARAADDASLTQSGTVAGTPLYMSPEQARGEKLDHRSDLFSLGSVLYTITSGRPPFRAETPLAVLARVAEDEPRPIPEIIPETPAWLCQLIAKLMAKNPDERFQTAAEVAAALEAGPTAPAAAPGAARSAARPLSRRLLWAGGGLALAAVLVLVGYLASLGRTPTNNGTGLPDTQPLPHLSQEPPAGGPAAGETFVFPGLRGTTLSPKGDVLAAAVSTGGDDKTLGRVLLWNVASGEPLGSPLLTSSTYVVQLAFSSNGERLAVGAIDGTVSVWDVKSRSKLRSHKLDKHPAALEFSPDGKWLMAGWTAPNFNPHHGWVRLWDAQTLEEARSFPATTNRVGTDVQAATFSPDGKQLVVGTMQGEIRFWDPATGQQTAPPRFVPDGAWALRFDPESGRLAVGNQHGAVFHWEEEKLQLLNEATRDTFVFCLAFSRDGKRLAWGRRDGRVYVRNQETGDVRLALTCKGDVRNLSFTPDGKRLIAAGQNDARPPRVWDTETGTEREVFQLPKGAKLP